MKKRCKSVSRSNFGSKFSARLMIIFTLILMSLNLYSADTLSPLSDKFNQDKLDKNKWVKGGYGWSIFKVHDGSLRMVTEGMQHSASLTTKRDDFDFFKHPLTVIWDPVSEFNMKGPYASTKYGKIYGGLAIGGVQKNSKSAQLGLTAWPEGFHMPKPDAPWYYTLKLGSLMPPKPDATCRMNGMPDRIIWNINATDWSVEIVGAKFTSGDPQKRSGKHNLKEADFDENKFALSLFASTHDRSMEPGAKHIATVLYTDSIFVVPAGDAQKVQAANSVKIRQNKRKGPIKRPVVLDEIQKPCKGQYMFGVNLNGAGFRKKEKPETCWPPVEELDYYANKGILLTRLTFKWERIQPKLFEPLDATWVDGLKETVKLMGERKMKVLLDLHNYDRYNDKLIGSTEVPYKAFTDVWKRLANIFKGNSTIYGYGLMNEPYNTNDTWPIAAQAGIDGVRSVDTKTMIMICSDAFSGAERWMKYGAILPSKLKDPSNNLCYEAHSYFERSGGGRYKNSYETEINSPGSKVGPMIAVEKFKVFVDWLKKNNYKGVIGELGVPANPDRDERWLVILDNAYKYLAENQIPSFYWSGGHKWTKERAYVIEPQEGKDRPQMGILLKHARKMYGTK